MVVLLYTCHFADMKTWKKKKKRKPGILKLDAFSKQTP